MGLVGFGQPDDGIIQMCYVVPEMHTAIDSWIKKLGVGTVVRAGSFHRHQSELPRR